ncbi:hypothetical protein IE53DRAFT_386017 [Violaceomyces palustris]|uniref:Uncharacterized protein n=1 Tax=Violaceomyces palustris TaxID=1673888 RepID=A0ACD0P0J0_9BASI|nr:hypothetical protein IE53DRAFT_386017 [Violaceomyces palustris]
MARPNLFSSSSFSNLLRRQAYRGSSRDLHSSLTRAFQEQAKNDLSMVPKVIYRGPPAMKRGLYYASGTIFAMAGVYQGYLLSEHLAWPIVTFDYEKNPPHLVHPAIRTVTGGFVGVIGVVFGVFFFWMPTRSVTRLTIYPATRQVGVRTSAPAIRAILPSALRSKNSIPINPNDRRERLHSLVKLYRRDGISAKGIADSVQGKSISVATGSSEAKRRRQVTSLLLGEKETLGYSLEAAPEIRTKVDLLPKSLYKRAWFHFKVWIRGTTDWTNVKDQDGVAVPLEDWEVKARKNLGAKEPWFLDRKNFDQLFPVYVRD